MIVCPVCEHPQAQGLECDVCGKDLSSLGELGGLDDLGGLGPPPVAVEAVPGLEVTVPDRVGEVPVERDAALEVNLAAPVGEVRVELVPDLDPTAAPVGEVPVERMTELDLDRAPDDGVRTPVATGAVTCRYCRNVQTSGAICDKCGMKLPRVAGEEQAAVVKGAELPWVRCRFCGAPNPQEERCKECGRLLPVPD